MPRQQPPSTPLRRQQLSPIRPKKKYSSAGAFYITILVILSLALLGAISDRRSSFGFPTSKARLSRREVTHGILLRRDLECRLVRTAKDQCAFIRANCPDEEAGLFSYLQLYYCTLQNAKPVAFVILLLWLGLLFSTIGIAASDFFCINLSTISSILGMSESMAGVTFLAFGNGSPDVFSTFAAMKTNSGSLAVGELIGAAGFITAVVAGSMAVARPFKVARKSFVRDVGFFIVAASFSMVFLADGHLHLWECAVMVAFYVFYVITVVAWHWYLRRRTRRRAIEDLARSHFQVPGTDEVENHAYQDEEDEDDRAAMSRGTTRTVSTTDFDNLERGSSPMLRTMDEEVDANDETRDRYLAEISSNMRLSRPRLRERRGTVNPIRPSLVGALEFRSVLASLQKSRNIQTIPINLRRYSDDPTYTAAQQQDTTSTFSNPEINNDDIDAHDVAENASLRASLDAERMGPNRVRAVSANDAAGLQLDPGVLRKSQHDLLGPNISKHGPLLTPDHAVDHRPRQGSSSSAAPSLAVVSPADEYGYLSMSPAPMSPTHHGQSGDTSGQLGSGISEPPDLMLTGDAKSIEGRGFFESNTADKPQVPRIQIPRAPVQQRSRASSRSSALSPFPAYYDDPNFMPTRPSRTPSLALPPPSIGSDSMYHQNLYQPSEEKPLRWWPYKVLPTPRVLVSTLFPTLYSWKDKAIWDKMLGAVAAPSIFLLAITLPIVEVDKEEDEGDLPETVDPDPGLLSRQHTGLRRGSTLVILPPDSPTLQGGETDGVQDAPYRKQGERNLSSPAINIFEPGSVSANKPVFPPRPPPPPHRQSSNHVQHALDPAEVPPSAKDWNRWLVATQLFTAPLFVVILLWANTDESLSIRKLLLFSLYSIVGSLLAFAVLVLTTTPSQPPRYRYLLCFLGFIVAIAWISTIANEVVGVLKAFGVILGMSDAILGLTIFAVGNSLGDLVADITVARLGYPVMALSACFGGPMLNILLGIGLSGLYMTISNGEKRHEKHPGKPMRFKPYQIDVGGTLLISGISLLVTLAGLLIVVPLRGWWLDRKVGWGLIILWVISTIGNVVVEVVGWGKEF